MPYVIELLSLGNDFHFILNTAASQLNAVQKAFEFRSISEASPWFSPGIAYKRYEYVTSDVYAFVEDLRGKHGGRHPYVIAFVDRPLRSPALSNLFGSHNAEIGVAVVTFSTMTQYVKEEARYCAYFLTRYSLSFVNPSIKSHNDPERSWCYFHKKIRKIDLLESMDSGKICDPCLKELEKPLSGACPSAEELNSLELMRMVVSKDIGHAIVLKGGGAKGLAFTSALLELEKYYWFDRHVGTSAGAIAAVLLAAGYSPAELAQILKAKSFTDFMDAGWWRIPLNLVRKRGAYPGERFRTWMAELISKKIDKVSEIKMSDLNGALVYASRRGPGTVEFDSVGERSETVAAFAVRCSMSIPLVFFPHEIDGRPVFDGGLRNNFPLQAFLTKHGTRPFIALYLGKRDDTNRRGLIKELLDIWLDGEERVVVDAHRESVVVIDTWPISTLDFNLGLLERQFLDAVGRAAVLEFLNSRRPDDGPPNDIVAKSKQYAEKLRKDVISYRRSRRLKRWLISVAIVTILVVLWWLRH